MSIRPSDSAIVASFIQEGGVFVCPKERCGRKFENEGRARDHWIRMHCKPVQATSSMLQSQHSSNRDFYSSQNDPPQKEEELKLPLINTSQVRLAPAIGIKPIGLHPSIRGAHEALGDSATGAGAKRQVRKVMLIPEKKSSMTTSLNQSMLTAASRPSSSSSSSLFNTTSSSLKDSSSTFNKSGYLNQEDLLTSANNMNQQLRPQQKNLKQSIGTPNSALSSTQKSRIPVQQSLPQSSSIQPKVVKKSNEEILFGKKTAAKLKKQQPLSSDEEEEEQLEDEERNDAEKKDPILQMNFSDDDEDDEFDLEDNSNSQNKISNTTKSNSDSKEPLVDLTNELILESSGCSELSEVEQLIVRKRNIQSISDSERMDWSELSSIWYIGVTHNPNLSDITGIASIPNRSLVELNLEYNNISNITSIFRHQQLQKLYLSGNRIPSIIGIHQLSSLNTLCLMKNLIRGFEDSLNTLSALPLLSELELEQNPISSRFNYKYDILWKLKLKKLDGDQVTDLDIELSRTFQSEYIQFCRENATQSTQMKRPQTAVPMAALNNSRNPVSYKDRFKMKVIDAPASQMTAEDKQIEMDRQIAEAQEQEENLERELLELQLQGKLMKEKQLQIEAESVELSSGISEYQQLQAQRTQLTQKYKGYVANLTKTSEGNEQSSSFIKAIFKLNLRIEELTLENSRIVLENGEIEREIQLTKPACARPSSSTKPISKNASMLANNKSMVGTVAGTSGKTNYDDCVDLESDSEKEKNLMNEENEDDDNEGEEYNEDALGLDIGFDSDDLDEETKEIKKMLELNEKSLKQVKKQLTDI